MEQVLMQILAKLNEMESEVKAIKAMAPQIEEISAMIPKIQEISALVPKIEESHMWLGALYKASEFHKADIDQVQHKVAHIEGALKGIAKNLEPFSKAQ